MQIWGRPWNISLLPGTKWLNYQWEWVRGQRKDEVKLLIFMIILECWIDFIYLFFFRSIVCYKYLTLSCEWSTIPPDKCSKHSAAERAHFCKVRCFCLQTSLGDFGFQNLAIRCQYRCFMWKFRDSYFSTFKKYIATKLL